jgi:hypothetical protein
MVVLAVALKSVMIILIVKFYQCSIFISEYQFQQ